MICPYCRTSIDPDPQAQKVCEGCATPHHPECFAENGGCTLFGCKFAPPDEPKVQVGALDVARAVPMTVPGQPPLYGAPRVITGFGDIQAPMIITPAVAAPRPAVAAPPPPPPPPSSGAAPSANAGAPAPAAAAAAPALTPAAVAPAALAADQQRFVTPGGIFDAAPDSAGNMVANQHPKSRLAFILLGLTLGIFGAHNFYAGYRKQAIIQLCITVLSVFYAAPITAIWAITEICTVDRDSKMVEFD